MGLVTPDALLENRCIMNFNPQDITQGIRKNHMSKSSFLKQGKQIILAVVLAGALVSQASADFLGFRAGVVQWDQSWEGNLVQADLTKNVSVADEKSTGFYASVELPIPLVPNLKVQSTPMNTSGKVDQNFTYEGKTLAADSKVDIQFDSQDVILYNQVLDNWVSLDLGLAFRHFDAAFFVENKNSDGNVSEEESAIIPMLYGAARFDLPVTGFYGMGEVLTLPAGDNTITDYKMGLGYESDFRVGAELGVRSNTIEIDVDGFTTNVSVEGAYIALTLHL
jgi:outer membrane protein